MENKEKSKLFEEQLRKFKYRVDYRVNESPRYRPLVGEDEEFDEIPKVTNEAGEEEDAPKPEGTVPPEPTVGVPAGVDAEPPVPAFDDAGVPPEGDMGAPAPVNPEPQVDEIQNEIIKHNIEAMKNIHSQLENLNNVVQGLNSKFETLNADVEEVREPTNTEKLMNKSKVSYPYYFNLNDLWSDNWFNQQRENAQEKGIKELPDGTFIADFDDLPQKSKIDIQNSFNEISESVKKKNVNEELEPAAKSEIDGVSDKKIAINKIYRRVEPLTRGFFSDSSWQNVHKIFKEFENMGLDWYVDKAEYDGSMPPQRKTWYFGIDFVDKMGKPKQIRGTLTAAGAGTTEDPLSRYDISLVMY
jgi:hypothetical protein